MTHEHSRRRRFPGWAYGGAALVSVVAIVVAAGWIALRGMSDDVGATSHGHGAVVSGSPSVSSPTTSAPPPSSLPDVAAQRRDRAEQLATDAGSAGRASGASVAADESAREVTEADLASARGWLEAALAWREDEATNGPWGLAVERANSEWATTDVAVTVVPNTALENIASDAAVHGAMPRIVETTDETDRTGAAPGEMALRAAVVFGTGDGWTRPGLRLLVGFQLAEGKVTAVFIDDGYVVSDPELLP